MPEGTRAATVAILPEVVAVIDEAEDEGDADVVEPLLTHTVD